MNEYSKKKTLADSSSGLWEPIMWLWQRMTGSQHKLHQWLAEALKGSQLRRGQCYLYLLLRASGNVLTSCWINVYMLMVLAGTVAPSSLPSRYIKYANWKCSGLGSRDLASSETWMQLALSSKLSIASSAFTWSPYKLHGRESSSYRIKQPISPQTMSPMGRATTFLSTKILLNTLEGSIE